MTAGDRAMAYVAWADDRWLPGWAAAAGSVDLRSAQPAEPPTAPISEFLDDLDRAGNNGWCGHPGKRDARRLLGELDLRAGLDTWLRHGGGGAWMTRQRERGADNSVPCRVRKRLMDSRIRDTTEHLQEEIRKLWINDVKNFGHPPEEYDEI